MSSKMIPKLEDPKRNRLKELIKKKAFIRRSPPQKPFKLASGGNTWVFFDCKLVTQDPEGISIIAEVMFDLVKDYNLDGIGGIATGSIPICTAVAQLSYLKGKPIPAFWVRHKRKKHGTENIIDGGLKPRSKIVIVDDVTTKGGSMEKAVNEVQKINCEIVELITMVDREEGARKKFEDRDFKFTAIFKKSDFKPKIT